MQVVFRRVKGSKVSIAVYQNAVSLYAVFDQHATNAEIDGVPVRVFKGSIVECYNSLGVSQSYYTPVMDSLKGLGCITVISSGRRSRPSVIALHHPPDETEFVFFHAGDLTGTPEAAKLRQRLENLEKRVGGINIADTLVEIDNRVSQLEHRIGKAQEFNPNKHEKE